jgi:preprotein translocase subunit SecE
MANIFARIPVFFREVKVELTKVAWPARHELMGATGVVIVVTAILTAYIGVWDFILSKIVTLVVK